MAGVTQVVTAGETRLFHNRLTHSLEVGQIARRIAERLLESDREAASALGGLDPDIAEAAGLAHDLGHPPFGHLAEKELDDCLRKTDPAGFEGNPQSFRIVTKLAVTADREPGLHLTRATLNAILKYPWPRGSEGFEKKKWGCYPTEESDFKWARELYAEGDRRRSLEAEIMDWSDDIAYSVLDVEDFYRAGLIPLAGLQSDEGERKAFREKAFTRWRKEGKHAEFLETLPASGDDMEELEGELANTFDVFMQTFPVAEPYRGTRRQRSALRALTSSLIARYAGGIHLNPSSSQEGRRVTINRSLKMEVAMLKELTWAYVIESPALASQQHGQKRVIRGLFDMYTNAAAEKDYRIFPQGAQDQIGELGSNTTDTAVKRVVVDLIASMTEQQALEAFRRLSGLSVSSIFDDPLL